MNTSNSYRNDHLCAKWVVFALYMMVSIVGIELGNPYLALTVGTPIWFFGVNTIGYLIEHLKGHQHCHHRI